MTEIKNTSADWRLDNIEITFQEWGDYKGKYTGKIKFANGDREAFTFNLRPEMAEQYLRLIRSEVTKTASTLGDKLMQTLDLLPKAPDMAAIAESIDHELVSQDKTN